MPESVQELINKIITDILNPVIVFLFVLATVLFVYGIALYLIGGQGDETKLDKGKKIILWGIIGMFVMSSAWGVVSLLCDFFGTCEDTTLNTTACTPPLMTESECRANCPEPDSVCIEVGNGCYSCEGI